MSTPIENLKNWFLESKRSFPWREISSPYAVWVSEIMLQQTRASVVVPYFNQWMKKFPTLTSLAESSLEEIFKVWEGLGYYSRARNLQKGAIQILSQGGEIPSTLESLLNISGIGPYTAGAILSFAFHQKALALDGNVERVASRYLGIEGDLKKEPSKSLLRNGAFSLLPDVEPWVVMEGLIELGATLCLPKNPKCSICPLKENCTAHLKGLTDQIPFKQKRQETIFLENQVVILIHGSEVLLEKKEEGKVLAGLIEFPSFEYKVDLDLESRVLHLFGLNAECLEDLKRESQTFTRYKMGLHPTLLEVKEKKDVKDFFWFPLDKLEENVTFSSGHKRILKQLLKKGY